MSSAEGGMSLIDWNEDVVIPSHSKPLIPTPSTLDIGTIPSSSSMCMLDDNNPFDAMERCITVENDPFDIAHGRMGQKKTQSEKLIQTSPCSSVLCSLSLTNEGQEADSLSITNLSSELMEEDMTKYIAKRIQKCIADASKKVHGNENSRSHCQVSECVIEPNVSPFLVEELLDTQLCANGNIISEQNNNNDTTFVTPILPFSSFSSSFGVKCDTTKLRSCNVSLPDFVSETPFKLESLGRQRMGFSRSTDSMNIESSSIDTRDWKNSKARRYSDGEKEVDISQEAPQWVNEHFSSDEDDEIHQFKFMPPKGPVEKCRLETRTMVGGSHLRSSKVDVEFPRTLRKSSAPKQVEFRSKNSIVDNQRKTTGPLKATLPVHCMIKSLAALDKVNDSSIRNGDKRGFSLGTPIKKKERQQLKPFSASESKIKTVNAIATSTPEQRELSHRNLNRNFSSSQCTTSKPSASYSETYVKSRRSVPVGVKNKHAVSGQPRSSLIPCEKKKRTPSPDSTTPGYNVCNNEFSPVSRYSRSRCAETTSTPALGLTSMNLNKPKAKKGNTTAVVSKQTVMAGASNRTNKTGNTKMLSQGLVKRSHKENTAINCVR